MLQQEAKILRKAFRVHGGAQQAAVHGADQVGITPYVGDQTGQPRRHGVQPQLREVLAYAGVGAALVPGAHSDPSPSLPSSSRLARAAASMSASA